MKLLNSGNTDIIEGSYKILNKKNPLIVGVMALCIVLAIFVAASLFLGVVVSLMDIQGLFRRGAETLFLLIFFGTAIFGIVFVLGGILTGQPPFVD